MFFHDAAPQTVSEATVPASEASEPRSLKTLRFKFPSAAMLKHAIARKKF